MQRICVFVLFLLLTSACAVPASHSTIAELEQQVMDTESAFAKTMAERDSGAFAIFISEQAIFFSGDKPLNGKQEVVDSWSRYFEKAEAPFSWAPETVEVLESGDLALSTGPVRSPSGKLVGTFTSIWRLEAPGTWRIVFDKGAPVCGDP